MSKPVILTGLRANNDLHIGNYLGALLPIVDLAKQKAGEYQINLFVPDLHSFTTPIDHGQLQAGIMNNLRVYAAAGLPLDNPNVYIYRQSYVPAHSELTWILDCFASYGQMTRMTQFKDKSIQRANEILQAAGAQPVSVSPGNASAELIDGSASIGLFNYPVLMASDILLYGAVYVPVGDDQSQHIEFTRDIAERMNGQFSELFVVPKSVKEQHEFFGKDQGLRIKDLADPLKKMSKSDETGKGVIFMTDTPDEARKKIMSATTDSVGKVNYDKENQAGISNLLDILKLLGGNPDEFMGQEQYGPLKTAVADKLAEFLTSFQASLSSVDDSAINAKLAQSEAAMNDQANATLLKVQKAVGLR